MQRDPGLTEDEWDIALASVQSLYADREIVEIVVEKRDKRPVEEGQDTVEAGLAMLRRRRSKPELDSLFERVGSELDCYIDTFATSTPPDFRSIILLVVSFVKKAGSANRPDKHEP
jgi:hypothetical protein